MPGAINFALDHLPSAAAARRTIRSRHVESIFGTPARRKHTLLWKSQQLWKGSPHDPSQATANLALQVFTLGLQIHQMAGILPGKARELFSIPPGCEAVTGFVLGYPGDPALLPGRFRDRELAPRERKPLKSFVFGRKWGDAAPFVK